MATGARASTGTADRDPPFESAAELPFAALQFDSGAADQWDGDRRFEFGRLVQQLLVVHLSTASTPTPTTTADGGSPCVATGMDHWGALARHAPGNSSAPRVPFYTAATTHAVLAVTEVAACLVLPRERRFRRGSLPERR